MNLLYVFSLSRSESMNRFRVILHMASSERQIPSDIGNRYCFWIWEKLIAIVPSSKKSTSNEQIEGAKKHTIYFACVPIKMKCGRLCSLSYRIYGFLRIFFFRGQTAF